MKICDLTYEEALKRHLIETNAITWRLRKGKSKARLLPAPELQWYYECSVRIEGSGSLADLLAGNMPQKKVLSLEEQVQDEVSRTGTMLMASHGRWRGSESVPNPPEVAIKARERLKADAREKARFAALTPEQQDAERDALLRQLSRSPGFMCVQIPRRVE
jgi:hypothetical protein